MVFAHVAFPLPVFHPYTYRVPESLADQVIPGARVVVPVRRQEVVGVVTATGVPAPDAEARDILAAPDPVPAVTLPLLETARWMAGYYGAPLGLCLRAMLPPGFWGRSTVTLRLTEAPATIGGVAGELLHWLNQHDGKATMKAAARALRRPLWDVVSRLVRVQALEVDVVPPSEGPAPSVERLVTLAGERLTLLERDTRFARKPRQRALYEALEAAGGPLALRHLVDRLGFSDGVIRSLSNAGLLRIESVEVPRDPFSAHPVSPLPDTISPAQAEAIEAIARLEPGTGALLFGVTGSGKTLVYLEIIRSALETGRGAILLVPEIGLTPQTVSRVRGAFGDAVAVLHSGLSAGERADAWRLLRRGDRRVAVGARSAVFAPVQDLGVIVVDEEHDTGYKNGEAPRYHAREVAAMRARLEGARLLLGSATPSLDTMARVGPGLVRVNLPERVQARPLPPVTLVDLRHMPLVKGTGAVAWSEALDQAVAATLAQGEQVLLLLNRRGYSSFLQCRSCGEVPECPRCSISLTVHRSPAVVRCHYCDYQAPVPSACAACGHVVQVERGVGTQQLEQLVAERFPGARLARMDLDTTGARWAHQRILGAVERREVDILLGTQMIAKGIDLPEVTLVGVVDADLALHLPDFRAAERTFQLLTQVAGRAGRGDRGGRVIVQTRRPEHHALVHAARHDVEGFLAIERQQRASPPYPPELELVNLIVSGEDQAAVVARVTRLADWCGSMVDRHRLDVTVLGPAPCPVVRIKDRWRYHVLLKGKGKALGRLVRTLAPRTGGRDVRVAIDRDPGSLL
jgi:primosomal protein N' (replication factor Y)